MSWYERCFRQAFKNIGDRPYLAEFDARKLVQYWKAMGAELVYLDASNQTGTMFPTQLSRQAVHLHGRDLIGEYSAACREFGVKCGVYWTPFEHTPFVEHHPEWCQTRTDGTMHEPWYGIVNYWACWNSPFVDKMCGLLTECFSRYPIDILQFDGLLSRHGVCHCRYCAARFRAEAGHRLPDRHDWADPVFRLYIRWKFDTITEATRKLCDAIRRGRPEALVDTNTPVAWCGWCACQPEEFFDAIENANVEVFPGFLSPSTPGWVQPSSTGMIAYGIAYTRGQIRRHPKVRAYFAIGDCAGWTTARIDPDLRLETQTAIAFGGLVNVQFEQPVMRECFDHIRRCEPYLVDTQPVPWAALAASQLSCDTQHGDQMQAYFEDLKGTYQVLLDLRLPAEFVRGRDLGEVPLEPYAVLILSDTGHVTAPQAAAIRKFVAAGGGLVATHQTSLIGEDGRPRENFLFADVLGVDATPAPDWRGTQLIWGGTWNAFLDFGENAPWWGDAVQPWVDPAAGETAWAREEPFLSSPNAQIIRGGFQPARARAGATVAAWIRQVGGPGRLPGIVEQRFGRGKAVYLAPRLGELYARYPFELWRRLLDAAARRAAARPPPVEVVGPACVLAAAWDQPGAQRWIVHLINDLDETGRPRARETQHGDVATWAGVFPRTRTIPVDGVEVLVRRPSVAAAELPLENRTLPVEQTADGFRIRVGRVEQHSLLVIQ